QRQAFKHGFSFSHLPHEQQAKIWDYIWQHSKNFEVMKQPLFYFESRIKQNDLSDWKILKTWVNKIENWEHADNYCKIISDLHERYQAKIYPTLKLWNKSKHLWTRRASIVSLFLYSTCRLKQPQFKKVIALIEPLISSDHHYLHKAVGWTLRECHNVYPKQTYQFLEKHIKDLAPATFSYATEKFSPAQKTKLKAIRKTLRTRR
ncbi:DNA alkylation repair protein, partial [Patescibacteria group bacterium]|nr:DNA alkylation repair protein [Patescibacteria group bacterium]